MELGVRDWMIVVGLLLIVAVLFDGFRRMRNDRRGKIRMSLNKNFVNSTGNSVEGYSTELPGGPRVICRDAQGDVIPEDAAAEGEDLHLDEAVPMLMESISASTMDDNDVVADDFSVTTGLSSDDESTHDDSNICEPVDTDMGGDNPVERSEASAQGSLDLNTPVQQELPVFNPVESEPVQQPASDVDGYESRNIDPASQEVIVVNVMAKDKPFKGADLLHILLACDCRFGDMSIFHRYEGASGEGPIQFSVVNSVEPGIFNLDDIDSFSTPGVCFFVKVPGPQQPIQAFDYMVETAQCLVKNLSGELRDETHSVMTSQTLEHCRQRIRDIERKQLTHA